MAKTVPQKKITNVSNTASVVGAPANHSAFWQRKHFTGWFVFFAAFLLFANSITGSYNLDDELVTINHRLTSKGISAIPEIFTSHYYQDQQGYAYEYRPLVLASFAIEHQFFGDNAHVSHFFNVLLYALCCLVLLQVLSTLFKAYSPLLPLAVTLLFIVHPAHTEVVCSIKNRDEILALLFSLITLSTALKCIEGTRKWQLVLVPVFFALALMAKTTVIAFAVIIPLALIFFTKANLRTVLLVTFLLIIPSFLLVSMGIALTKILALAAVFVFAMAVYVIVNFDTYRPAVLPRVNRIKNFLISTKETRPEIVGEERPFRVKDIFSKAVIPGRGLLSFWAIALTVILAGTYLFGIQQFHTSFSIIPLVILMLLAWRGGEALSWWATIMIGLCVTLDISFHPVIGYQKFISEPYSDLIATYLVLQILFGKRSAFIPTFFTLILFVLVHYMVFGKFHIYYLVLLLLINEPYVLYGALVIHVVSVITLSRFSHREDYWFDLTRIFIQIFSIVWIKINKGMRILPALLLISAAGLFHFAQKNQDREFQNRHVIYRLEKASDKINPQIVSTPEDRPLMYAEECMDNTTPLSVRMGTSLHILFLYLYKVAVPYPLSFYYGFKYISPEKMAMPIPIVSLILYVLLLGAAVFTLKRERLLSFGLLVYLISVAEFANYLEPVPGMFADRFLLVPSLGWAIVLALIIQKIFRADLSVKTTSLTQVPAYARYVLGAVLLLYACETFSRNLDWQDDITLMRHDINTVPESVQAQNLLGIHLLIKSFQIGDIGQQAAMRRESLEHLKKADALFPGFFNYNFDIGRTYRLLNMPDSALVYFKNAYAINPDYPDASLNITDIYVAKSDFQAAIPYFIKLMQKSPNDYSLYAKLSFAYFNVKQFGLSVQTNEDAIRRFPNRVQPYINIALCYITTNNNDSARVWLNRALIANPGNTEVINYLKQLK